ncbi:MAG: ABC-type transport auxiliary lipoprotein family protein [Chthoniobacterales bacterium]
MKRAAFFALIALIVSGCSTAPRAKPEYFMLSPGKPASMQALKPAGGAVTASVSFVDVAAPFAADGFVYRVSDDRWETDPYNQFLVSPADMMTSIIRNWTRESGLYGDVAMPGAGGSQEYVIDCDLTELYGDFRNAGKPEAVVTIEAQVFHNTDNGRVLLLRKTFSERVPVAARTPVALVNAWSEGVREELSQLLRAIGDSGH